MHFPLNSYASIDIKSVKYFLSFVIQWLSNNFQLFIFYHLYKVVLRFCNFMVQIQYDKCTSQVPRAKIQIEAPLTSNRYINI